MDLSRSFILSNRSLLVENEIVSIQELYGKNSSNNSVMNALNDDVKLSEMERNIIKKYKLLCAASIVRYKKFKF